MHLSHMPIRPPGIVLVRMVTVIISLCFCIVFSSTVNLSTTKSLLSRYVKLYDWTFSFSCAMQRNLDHQDASDSDIWTFADTGCQANLHNFLSLLFTFCIVLVDLICWIDCLIKYFVKERDQFLFSSDTSEEKNVLPSVPFSFFKIFALLQSGTK